MDKILHNNTDHNIASVIIIVVIISISCMTGRAVILLIGIVGGVVQRMPRIVNVVIVISSLRADLSRKSTR